VEFGIGEVNADLVRWLSPEINKTECKFIS